MRFWDSSALLPLIVEEAHSPTTRGLVADDPGMIVWWGSQVECASAVHRLRREGALSAGRAAELLARLATALGAADVVQPTEEVAASALRVLASHPLRAGDALQLAAALVWAGGRPRTHELVTLDDRLREAALLEGFSAPA